MGGFLNLKNLIFFSILIISSPSYGQFEKTTTKTQDKENVRELNNKLLNAAYEGKDELVLKLLEAGADPNTTTWNGITPLMFAADNGQLKTVKILVLNGADVNKKPENEITAFISAAIDNNLDIVEFLIRHGADIDDRDSFGVTSLIYAAAYNYYQLCDMLIYYQGNIEIQDNEGINAAMAATYAGNYELTELLLDNGAQVNQKDNEGYTALMLAGQTGDTSLIRLLLKYSANTDNTNKYGLSAIHLAIKNGNLDAVRVLKNAGAKLTLPDKSKFTVNKLAAYSENKKIKRYLNKLDIKKTFKPAIDIFIINPIVKFNTSDLYLGSKIGIIDKNLKTGIHFGFFPRIFRKRILIKSDEKKFYQYYEKRSNIELSIDKYLHLLNLASGASVDFYAFGKFVYSIGGNYPGSEKKAESVARIVPGFGIKWGDELFKLNVGYEYFNLGIKNINSHWINVGISLNINMHKKKLEDRIIEWY